MDYKKLAEELFPDVKLTRQDIEQKYPKRELKEGAKVTRFAPSPTGFVHFGGLFPALVSERLAHLSDGILYLRIEDTDAKREVEGAANALITTLSSYGIDFDEGAVIDENGEIADKGAYGPYKQSKRKEIYQVFAKELVEKGLAYPVFTSLQELEELKSKDKKTENNQKDWQEDEEQLRAQVQKERSISFEEVQQHLANGDVFVLKMLSNGDPDKKVKFSDLVKGTLELPENDRDEVLLKSDGIPSYHFAHAVDDYLMGTTHVVRGEEWLPSLPRHIMLFNYLGFKMPKYLHISQLMRLDENGNKKKLSKRDMGANLNDYKKLGYCSESVCEYVMTLLNSNYEEWHKQNPDKNYKEFPFNIKKMSISGALFDFDKLNDVSKNVISKFSANKVIEQLTLWAKEFDEAFYNLLTANEDMLTKFFAIGRGGKKPRKDFATWVEAKDFCEYMLNELFVTNFVLPENIIKEDAKKILQAYKDVYNENDDNSAWFDKVKSICEPLGFCADMKQYKQSPDEFKGSVADVSTVIRIAVTNRANTPDLCTIMQLLGKNTIKNRIDNAIAFLK